MDIREAGRKGGKSTAKKLSKEQRIERARRAGQKSGEVRRAKKKDDSPVES